jgi:hypothetical protein
MVVIRTGVGFLQTADQRKELNGQRPQQGR